MLTLTERFKYAIVAIVLFILLVAIFFGTVELALVVIMQLVDQPLLFFGAEDLVDVFGFVFVIMIGLEILTSIKGYVIGKYQHLRIVYYIAMLAIARQVVLIRLSEVSPLALIGIASIIVALSGGYYIMQRTPVERGGST
ncbi:MAG: phosphate-starvation-inducible PsiE family protein [Candidatus Omnitrophica bacterium]|nr:phosphate-starvation-inducible PsiE family protein [Candidatus Omnitrophota bacterium]